MNLFSYIAVVTALISFNYALAFLIATWAVINNFYLPYDYLEKLLIISQFSFSIKIFFNIFSKADFSNLDRTRMKVNLFEAYGGILFTLFAILWFDVGLYMDISNLGLDNKVYIQIFFIIYNVGVGSFLSSMINDLLVMSRKSVPIN